MTTVNTLIGLTTTTQVTYAYNGVGQVVGTNHLWPDVMWNLYGSSGSYPDLDRFDRVVSSRWTRDSGTAVDFYDVTVTYDPNSNVELTEDNIMIRASSGDGLFDADYTMDDLNRLAGAEEGHWNGSSISTTEREQQWTLDHVGNWDHVTLDLDGDGTFTDPNEYDDDRTHNEVNELTGRDVDGGGIDCTGLSRPRTCFHLFSGTRRIPC